VGLSVSRIGNKVQSHALRWVSGSLRLDLLQHQELLRLTRFASTTSAQFATRQRRGALLRRLMTQPVHQPVNLEDQILLFYAFQTGRMDRLTDEGIAICVSGLSHRLPAFALEVVQRNEPLTPAAHAKIDAGLEDALSPYRQPEEPAHAVAKTPA